MKSFVFIVTMKITTCVLLGLLTICFARPAEGKIHSSKFCIKNNCISIVILLQSCFKQLYLFIDNEKLFISYNTTLYNNLVFHGAYFDDSVNVL